MNTLFFPKGKYVYSQNIYTLPPGMQCLLSFKQLFLWPQTPDTPKAPGGVEPGQVQKHTLVLPPYPTQRWAVLEVVLLFSRSVVADSL